MKVIGHCICCGLYGNAMNEISEPSWLAEIMAERKV
jgi:S-adenosylmethionine/arginine decarboxylase-like enzyme